MPDVYAMGLGDRRATEPVPKHAQGDCWVLATSAFTLPIWSCVVNTEPVNLNEMLTELMANPRSH